MKKKYYCAPEVLCTGSHILQDQDRISFLCFILSAEYHIRKYRLLNLKVFIIDLKYFHHNGNHKLIGTHCQLSAAIICNFKVSHSD